MDFDGGQDFALEATQPRQTTQDHVGIRERKAGRSTFKVFHLYFNVLSKKRGRGER